MDELEQVGVSVENRGSWIQTHTGRRFYLFDPREEDIDIEDIAHALSLISRFGGHSDRYISVATHSLNVLWGVFSKEQKDIKLLKTALLHDAAKAYLGDIPRPIKYSLPVFKEIENSLWTVIARKFDLYDPIPNIIKEIDNRVLSTEKHLFFSRSEDWPNMPEPYETLKVWPRLNDDYQNIKDLFLSYWGEYI